MQVKFIFFISCVLSVCACQFEAQNNTDSVNENKEIQEKEATMNSSELNDITGKPVMFYNVQNLFDVENDLNNDGDDEFLPDGPMRWDDERYQTKLDRIAEVMRMPNDKLPLIMGFCEIENRKVLEDLCEHKSLNSTEFRIVHYDSEDRRGIDVGFIYDASCFKVLREEKLSVRISNEPEFRTRDILYVKGAVKGNHEIHVFVNHWPSKREGEKETEYRRIAAAKVLRTKIESIVSQDPDANILVMGDFNDTPMHTSIRTYLKGKGQHEQGAGDLVNLMWKEHNDEEGSIVHDGEWQIIDQIIVSQELIKERNLYVEKNDAKILKNEKLIFKRNNGHEKPKATYGGENYYGAYSDHLPVYCFLNIK